MSRFVQGNCVEIMAGFPDNAVDFILTDPPYLVGFRDRQGRTIAGDVTDEWLQPACHEMYRVLKKDALMVSFTVGTVPIALFPHGKRRGLASWGISFSPKRTRQNQLMSATHMNVPIFLRKAAHACHNTRYPMCKAGNIAAIGIIRPRSRLRAYNRSSSLLPPLARLC